MVSKIIIFVFIFHICLTLVTRPSKAQTWIRAGYYSPAGKEFPSSDINSALFTHLLCGYGSLNSSSYEVFIEPSDENYFSSFTATVKQKNPSVTTLASIGGGNINSSTFYSMLGNPSYRRIFIDTSIKIARHYGFQGLDLDLLEYTYDLGVLFKEWQAAINLEARSSNQSKLILTAAVWYSPNWFAETYPIDSMQYLNWIHINFYLPQSNTSTSAPYALYNPTNVLNVNSAIKAWIDAGIAANKLVMFLPYLGYAWTLANSNENEIGAPAIGTALTSDGVTYYAEVKDHIKQNGAQVMFNATYVVNYCQMGATWIAFDDVEAVQMKVSYAKEKGLLGYVVWQVSYDDNWVLSRTAAEQEGHKSGRNIRRLLIIILPTSAAVFVLLIGFAIYYSWMRMLKLKESSMEKNNAAAAGAGDFRGNDPNLIAYSLADIEVATNGFSIENKLGEGGYGPVYKGMLPNGLEVAVKKLSRTSTQGFEEFKNEVILTAKLQHVNLVRLLGFCIDRKEHMLIYEYMSNKSLDNYLFDPVKKYILNWEKRVYIIEDICQGLLYLQEYSRLTIIHRDLKASNILLDEDMKAKISDFGMARIFTEDSLEANTDRIVGTYGYVPPEYVKRGIYSTKSDVYSFGVLLLQIISGKRISTLYGENDQLTLLEYAYDLWKDDKGMEFMEPALDDTYSSCRLMRCLQIALLCVQEVPIERPSMSEVFTMLQNESMVIMIPKKPAFSKQTNEGAHTTANVEICSINDTTLSSLEAR